LALLVFTKMPKMANPMLFPLSLPMPPIASLSAVDCPRFASRVGDGQRVATTLHLIGSAHLDPVWLWDWREGMNEGIATCRAMVGLLKEFPEFRFIRGEAAIYAHIERYAPELFESIRELVREGRWDVVGGNWIQPDTNLPSTEALLRQFVRGKGYFREKFDVEVTSAWAADSFGHSAGIPEILTAAGMANYAFTRPQSNILPMRSQAFWWRGRSGARILAYRPHDGWYASERAEIGKRLDACLAHAVTEELQTVAMFYGLGNHGGGPSRAHLQAIREWSDRHPEVRVEHSGLHRFFAALRDELVWRGEDAIPTHEGELNFCLRGCSASVARFKYAYRGAESRLLSAERTVTALRMACPVPGMKQVAASLDGAWDTLLFNAFHDILPGSAIERAYDDQLAQIGSVSSVARSVETSALTGLAASIDTTAGAWPVPVDHPLPQPVLVWNPHPWTLRTQVEVEVSLDYRPLWTYHGRHHEAPVMVTDSGGGRLPFQLIAEEHDSMVELLWRRRAVVPVEVPPMGWTLLQMGLDPQGQVAKVSPDVKAAVEVDVGATWLRNARLSLSAVVGAQSVVFEQDGRDWLPGGLSVRLYEDPWGAWGGMQEERESWELTEERECFAITQVELLEKGPERGALWVRFSGKKSRGDITFLLGRESRHVEMRVRAFIDDRGARLKLVLPSGGAAEYAVPGGAVRREPCGEVPGGRWVLAGSGDRAVGFASDALYGFDTTETEFRATIARTSRYASDVKRAPCDRPWQPCADLGEHRFRALLTPDLDALSRLADELEEPPVVLTVPAHALEGAIPFEASSLEVNSPVRLLALYPSAEEKIVVRVQNPSLETQPVTFTRRGQMIGLGRLQPGAIGTWVLPPPRQSTDDE
jgi:alpha-mannosidase